MARVTVTERLWCFCRHFEPRSSCTTQYHMVYLCILQSHRYMYIKRRQKTALSYSPPAGDWRPCNNQVAQPRIDRTPQCASHCKQANLPDASPSNGSVVPSIRHRTTSPVTTAPASIGTKINPANNFGIGIHIVFSLQAARPGIRMIFAT